MLLWSLVPLICWAAYAALLVGVCRHRPWKRVHRAFAAYLVGVCLWSGFAFLLYSGVFSAGVEALSELCLITGMFSVVAYYHFLRSYAGRAAGIGVFAGYGILITVSPLIIQNHISYVITATTLGAAPRIAYSEVGIAIIALGSLALTAGAVVSLVQCHRSTVNPLERGKAMCLILGFLGFSMLGVANLHPFLAVYPLAYLGAALNALLIFYAMARFQLLDVAISVRKGLAHGLAGLYCAVLYAVLLVSLVQSLGLASALSISATGAGLALVVFVLYFPVTNTIREWLERANYGESYNYRRLLLTFSEKMGNVLELESLADYMLSLVTKGIHAAQASLFLPESGGGDYVARFISPLDAERDAAPRLSRDNPVVLLLGEGKPLSRDQFEALPPMKTLWEKEREQLQANKVEMLLPVKNKGALVAVLAVSKKLNSSRYRGDDIDLVARMLGQAGVVIENAQLYAAAKTRANTDELTGLFNHRYFHERLEEEINRGLRFGVIFSLLLLDLDLFKRYNDIHGHLAGDEVLRQVGSALRNSLRNIDKAFRYGGDEFAVMLPGTSGPNALRVAERIRKNIEEAMGSREILMSCSIGAASWPTDGVMRDALVHSADSALYHAKRWGNRTCLATDVIPSTSPLPDVSSKVKQGILSTIYALAATVDARDHHTYGHSRRVSNYAVALAEALGLPPDRVAAIQTAGLLHDIGKIGISDEVLNKRAELTEEEWKPIYSHPTLGVSILKHIDGLAACLPGIQYHHERFDGSGYPSGLRGVNIPMDARIISIADAYEAMTSPRPYRDRTLSVRESLTELERNAGRQFDPDLVQVFLGVIRSSIPEEAGVGSEKPEGRLL